MAVLIQDMPQFWNLICAVDDNNFTQVVALIGGQPIAGVRLETLDRYEDFVKRAMRNVQLRPGRTLRRARVLSRNMFNRLRDRVLIMDRLAREEDFDEQDELLDLIDCANREVLEADAPVPPLLEAHRDLEHGAGNEEDDVVREIVQYILDLEPANFMAPSPNTHNTVLAVPPSDLGYEYMNDDLFDEVIR